MVPLRFRWWSVFWLVALMAAAQQTGVLYGQLIDADANRPIPDVSVTLRWTEGETPQELTTTTDAEGRYRFEGLPLDPAIAFTLEATVQGRTLRRSNLAVSEWTPEVRADLRYAQVTDDPSQVRIQRWTIVLPPAPTAATEGVEVIEFLQVQNDGQSPYAVRGPSGQEVGLRFPFPPGVHEARAEGEGLDLVVEGNVAVLRQPVAVGATMVTLSYHLPEAERFDLSRQTPFPIDEVLILRGNRAVQLDAPAFQPGEPAQIHGETYQTYRVQSVPAGERVSIAFRRVAAPPGGSGTAQLSTGGVPLLIVVLIGAIALAAGATLGAWLAQSRMRPSGAGAEDPALPDALLDRMDRGQLETLREWLLEHIAALDSFFDKGRLPSGAYNTLRNAEKRRLARILHRLQTK